MEIASLYRLILPFAPAASDPLVDQAVILSAREFCERTRCWRHVADIALDGSSAVVDLPIPDGADLFEIENVWIDGRELRSRQVQDLAGRDVEADASPPRSFSEGGGNSILLDGITTETLRVSLFLRPTLTADELPSALEGKQQALAAGALGNILMLPGQAWTNPQLAAIKQAEFVTALDRDFALNIRGRQRAPARTRARYL